MRAVIWLDRDGTILDDPGYLRDPKRVVLLPEAAAAIARANAADVAVVLVTNQSGIARGLLSTSTLDEIHAELHRQLAAAGARLDGVYYCPHLPAHLRADGGCECRKPGPGMVHRAQRDLGYANLPAAVIGDKVADVGLAASLGIPSILVLTGQGRAARKKSDASVVVDHVGDGVDWFLGTLE